LTITAWRIFKKKHRATALTGEGARLFGGRWNSRGVPVIYTSQSAALAVLEMLVHLHAPEILNAYLLAPVTFVDTMVETVARRQLPAEWRKDPSRAAVQAFGDRWGARGAVAVLRVPSVVIDTEYNYLINPAHADFAAFVFGQPKRFKIDRRLGSLGERKRDMQ
jgi:RES domain-containing protein